MSDGAPTLEVGFAISPEFGELQRLQEAMNTTEGRVVAEAARIEQATTGMVKLGGATAQITTFGGAATREMANVARETKAAERAGEGMVRQLERQISVFGKTASEVRQMRAEMRAVAAENAGLTELAGRLRAASAEMDRLESGVGRVGVTTARSRATMVQFGMQMNDVATMAALGAPPMQIFASQIGQIVQVAQQAEGGVRGFTGQLGGLIVRFGPLIAVVSLAAGAFALFSRAITSDIDTKPMIDSLGLTRDEIKKLKDTSVDTGDVVTATFQVLMERVGINMAGVKKFFGDAMDFMTTVGRNALAGIYASFVGTFRAIGAIVQGVFSGKSVGEILSDVGNSYKGAFDEANQAMVKFGQDVEKRIRSNKLAELTKQADELKADRTPKKDSRAESLAREAKATEAQIRNLYALADAYGVSGAAALIAEARVKAESEAIKKRADIEERVARQVRLAVAQRVADAAKATAGLREQIAVQEQVNEEVRAGNVHAALANEMVRDRIADLPLLAALEAARLTGDARGALAAADALDRQREARDRLTDAERASALTSALAAGRERLEQLQEETRLIGASNEVSIRALAILRSTQEAARNGWSGERAAAYVKQQVDIAAAQYQLGVATNQLDQDLRLAADRADEVADSMSRAFGRVGSAIGDVISILGNYGAAQSEIDRQVRAGTFTQAQGAKRSADLQMNSLIGLTGAAKGFFKENSKGYKAMEAAERALTLVQLARTAIDVAGGAARMFATLGPFAFPAVAAMLGVMASLGFSGGGASSRRPETNTGTGTVFGDSEAKSESIKRSIDALREVDTLMLGYSREMAASLRSIDSQIGNVATLVVRAGNVNASMGVKEGFNSNLSTILGPIGGLIGNIPVIGGILKSLFGTKTTVVGSGIAGGPQSLGSILSGGFDADYFSDVQRKKRFLGLTYSTKYRTQFADADPALESQFTLILKSFNDAILASAAPLGQATADIQNRLSSFVVNIGKIDLKDLTGEEIQEKLSAVFGAAADQMAAAAFPGLERFQKVGEGAFETLVRVASTVEAVTESLGMLGGAAAALGIDAKMGLADQFDTIGALTGAVDSYFERFYTKAEQTAARTAQFGRVFESLGLTMPPTLAAFRALVEAQNLNTEAGRATYATLLQLAPAFADLQQAMDGAKSAADILSERADLERKLLEVQGNTEALRALDLAKLDASNRALQMQIWAVQDAKEAARAADELRKAWTDIGTSIMDEVKRIRGLTDPSGTGSFAMLQGQFNAATAAARTGDQEAAKSLPGLSQALLKIAADTATSRQELARVQAQTAASLEATFAAISGRANPSPASATDALLAAMTASQAPAPSARSANDNLAGELASLREEMVGMRRDMNAGQAAIAGNTGKVAKHLDNVTAASGGDAINVATAA